jgi:hypothetical protein
VAFLGATVVCRGSVNQIIREGGWAH